MIGKQIYLIPLLLLSHVANAAELPATIEWSGLREIGLPISGIVASVNAQPGAFVQKDAALLSLDCGMYDAKQAQSQAIVEGLEPSVERAQKDKELADELFERTVLSEVEHRDAELIYIEKKSRYQAAKAIDDENRWLQQQCDLKADRHLIVLDVKVKVGEVVNLQQMNAKLMVVADRDAMEAKASVALPLKKSLKPGKKLKVEVSGQLYKGRVTAIRFLADNTAEITAKFSTFDPRLISSKNAKLIIQ